MSPDLGTVFRQAFFQHPALVFLVGVVLVLALLALSFGVYAFLLRLSNERTAARWRALEADWEEPLLAALVEPAALPALWERVQDGQELRFVDFVLRYARRVTGPERRILERAAEPYLELLVPRLGHRDHTLRVRAVQTLGTLGLPRFEDEVVRALDDPSTLVAMVAARSLARRELAHHTHALMARLPRFRDWSGPFLSAMLARIGPGASEALRWTLADQAQSPWVRAVAAEALWRLADPASADVAAAIVAREGDRELMAAALRLLARVGRPEHARVARARVGSPDFVVRSHALTALGQVGGDEDIPLLKQAVGDRSPWVAIHAARGLRAVGGERALAELAEGEGERAELAVQVLSESEAEVERR